MFLGYMRNNVGNIIRRQIEMISTPLRKLSKLQSESNKLVNSNYWLFKDKNLHHFRKVNLTIKC